MELENKDYWHGYRMGYAACLTRFKSKSALQRLWMVAAFVVFGITPNARQRHEPRGPYAKTSKSVLKARRIIRQHKKAAPVTMPIATIHPENVSRPST